jgi:hypothetical protein
MEPYSEMDSLAHATSTTLCDNPLPDVLVGSLTRVCFTYGTRLRYALTVRGTAVWVRNKCNLHDMHCLAMASSDHSMQPVRNPVCVCVCVCSIGMDVCVCVCEA